MSPLSRADLASLPHGSDASIGLLTNARWVTREFAWASRWLEDALGTGPLRLFTPEHGPWGEAGPGEDVADTVDPVTGARVISLYGPRSSPDPSDLEGLDLLALALPDVGARAWTYLTTSFRMLAAAAEAGVPVLVLDRPNPLGSRAEGPGVPEGGTTFVAAYDLPLRHGLTAGELARLYAVEQGLPAPAVAQVPPPPVWVAPSPNLPTPAAALAFAGLVLLEGTNLSEGRGTTRPFTLVGAPWLDGTALAERLRSEGHPGLRAQPTRFTPVASKHAGEVCGGVELHITDAPAYRALPVALSVLAFARAHPEFEVRASLDRLWGGPGLSRWLGATEPDPAEVLTAAEVYLEAFAERVAAVASG